MVFTPFMGSLAIASRKTCLGWGLMRKEGVEDWTGLEMSLAITGIRIIEKGEFVDLHLFFQGFHCRVVALTHGGPVFKALFNGAWFMVNFPKF
jgi:hypothetical protein